MAGGAVDDFAPAFALGPQELDGWTEGIAVDRDGAVVDHGPQRLRRDFLELRRERAAFGMQRLRDRFGIDALLAQDIRRCASSRTSAS